MKGALAGFEAWQKEQDASKVNQRALPTTGPLLDRMGGADYVKRVAELFYRKMYADEQLAPFLGEHDVVSLRAKQNAFLIWAFGPPNRPYPGRHLRTAHLRLIKQKGFTAEHFERGLKLFEEALKEMDAPPSVVRDTMTKLRPYKTVVFTPSSARDAEEELRWVKEERMREQREQREQRALHKTNSTASTTSVASMGSGAAAAAAAAGAAAEGGVAGRAVSRSAGSGTSASQPRPGPASAAGGDQGASTAAAAQHHGSGTGGISDSDQSISSSAAGRAAAGAAAGPSCPFSGGRLSRPSSSTVMVPPAAASAGNSVTTPTSDTVPSPVATPTRSPAPRGPNGAAGGAGGPPLSRLSGSQLFPPPFPAGGINSPAHGSGRAGHSSANGSFSGPSGGVAGAAGPGLLGGPGSSHGSFSSSQVHLPPSLAGLPPPPPLPPLHMLATRGGGGNGPPSGAGTPRASLQREMAAGGSGQAVSLSGGIPSSSPLASAGGNSAFGRRSAGRASFDFGSGPSTMPSVRQPSPSHLSQMTSGSMPGGVVSAAAEAEAPVSSPVVRAAPAMAWTASSAAAGSQSATPKAPPSAKAAGTGGDASSSGGIKKLAPPAAVAREGSDVAAAAAAAAAATTAQQQRAPERWAQPAGATPGSGGGAGGGSGSGTAGTGTGTAGTGSHSPNYHMQFMKPPSPGHMSSGMSSPGAMKRLA
ncbi:hypothetical protein HYH02_003490 [Chlamydomonas schloesseri]|uniref:Uncharacterized protein n=1 Tax=Chlamydomonas schloesseri TaxID=2026947 RepID=A0A835WSC8_9CHLO|nr:hypothetical protein HYH02_003490 [Chlamydomonas schloesseri]|eukprot:KAG2451710.1 hypothetical protein HYH02_003490 [Chlamydomonas schloesseri]